MSGTAIAGFEHALPLEGAFNLRDLGGYETADGGRVKRGLLYRSGTMARLTEADERHLAGLGFAMVCDLRRPGERMAEPTRWCEPAGVRYWSSDHVGSSGVLEDVFHSADATVEAMRAAMIAIYRAIPSDHAQAYRMMFETLRSGHVPLLFNCAAGKDRTGVAAALILHALGVPHDMIVEDYLLTNVRADFSIFLDGGQSAIGRLAQRAPDVVAPLFAADADYLAETFKVFDSDFGGIDGYLASELGVETDAVKQLRTLLVE